MATRPFIKVDPLLPERKDYYPDGAFRALVETLCAAAYQPTSGEFKSEKYLRIVLGKRQRWVPFLVEEGDLGMSSTGVVFVNHWKEWQEGQYKSVGDRMAVIRAKRGPMTPAERAYMYRQRKRDENGVTPRVTVGLSHSDSDSDLDRTRRGVTGLKNVTNGKAT